MQIHKMSAGYLRFHTKKELSYNSYLYTTFSSDKMIANRHWSGGGGWGCDGGKGNHNKNKNKLYKYVKLT